MSGYFARLARQSGIGLGPAAEVPVSASVEAPAAELLEVHEERESIPVARAGPAAVPPQDPLPTGRVAASQPAAFVQPDPRQSRQALHLDAIHQVVEWIAAAPPPSPEATRVRPETPESPERKAIERAPLQSAPSAATRAIATALRPAVDRSRLPPTTEQIEELVVRQPAALPLGARAAERARAATPERTEADPSTESLSVSIGSIQVTVEAPPQPAARAAAPVQHASPPPYPAPSRLRRHYLRPY